MSTELKCPKCGSTNIAANKDINNAWIRCEDCGYYLREGHETIKPKHTKKKIGELTLFDVQKYCMKHFACRDCPLYAEWQQDGNCCKADLPFKYNEEVDLDE